MASSVPRRIEYGQETLAPVDPQSKLKVIANDADRIPAVLR